MNIKNLDGTALYNFDRFRISQPHVPENGVWRTPKNEYIIHCPDLQGFKTLNGVDLKEWFRLNKIMGLPISLSETIPPDSAKLNDRTLEEIALQVGRARTFDEVYYELNFELSKNFPEYQLHEAPPLIVYFVTERELTTAEQAEFESTKAKLGFYFSLEHKVGVFKPKAKSNPPVGGQGLRLTPSRELKGVSNRIIQIYEEDQDLWKTERVGLLTSTDIEKNFIPKEWEQDGYRCLVQSTAFEPQNIRSYLSLNDSVIYEMPFQNKLDQFYKASGIVQEDLLELYALGRVKFVLKHGLEQYPLELLERLIEINPRSTIFPRRLACQNIIEVKKRMPLLIPPFGMAERKAVLAFLMDVKKQSTDPNLSAYLELIISEFSRIWGQIDYRVLREGPMSGAAIGLGAIAGGLYKILKGKDLNVEFMTAAPGVEMAFALKANLFPIQTPVYTDEAHARMLMSLYDGIPRTIPTWTDRTRLITDQLLAVGDHVPVIEFAKELRKGDLARFRRLVHDLARSGAGTEELNEAVNGLNKEVKAFENKEHLLNKIDIVGLLVELGTFSGSTWLMQVLSPFIEKMKVDHASIGAVFDTLEGMKTLDPPYRPLLARIRKNLKTSALKNY
jgi:hypothetical protein